MMHSQEPRVSSSQDSLCLNNNSSVSALVKRLNSCTATPPASKGSTGNNEEEKKVLAILPWLPQFSMLSRFSLGSRNIKQLKKLMSLYLGHISEMVKKSLKKTVRAAKLKKNMSEVLVMFHMRYLDIRESFEQGSYLDTMSDLVAMYLDMEIRASKRMKETLPNVVSRLTMYLYILLGNSEIHILETILKARLFTKHHEKICAPIIGKVVGSAKPSSLQTMMYVRYLLVYKLWKRVAGSSVERIRINKLAMQKLVAPASLLDKSSAPIFISVLPKKPKTKKNTTMFFMQAKFDLKKSVQAFLKLLKESKISDFPAVMTKKSASLSSPSPFLDIESSVSIKVVLFTTLFYHLN
ncbi:uncharacterized protein LOC134546139 isoform X2 [Bacillus rossius redtenbacheri]|uniref:uncharacterized protein LOC134546139 isoform X2 n=1 Tax=Bacillus rossius redtenbacheri TaxID=93214 RepID=UPI002FDD94E9